MCDVSFDNHRDDLKTLLDQSRSSVDVDLTDTSQFRFRSKTLATVATNNRQSSVGKTDVNRITNGNITPGQGTL